MQIGQDIDGDQDGAMGYEVSINGDGSVISSGACHYDNSGEIRGLAHIFKYSGSEWIQRGIDILGHLPASCEGYITNLSEDGAVLSTGAPNY